MDVSLVMPNVCPGFDLQLFLRGVGASGASVADTEAYCRALCEALAGADLPPLREPAPQLRAAAALGRRLTQLDDLRGPQAELVRMSLLEPGPTEEAMAQLHVAALLRTSCSLRDASWVEDLAQFAFESLGLAFALPDRGSACQVLLSGPLIAVVGAAVTFSRVAQRLSMASDCEVLCSSLAFEAWPADVLHFYASGLRRARVERARQWLRQDFVFSDGVFGVVNGQSRKRKAAAEFQDGIPGIRHSCRQVLPGFNGLCA